MEQFDNPLGYFCVWTKLEENKYGMGSRYPKPQRQEQIAVTPVFMAHGCSPGWKPIAITSGINIKPPNVARTFIRIECNIVSFISRRDKCCRCRNSALISVFDCHLSCLILMMIINISYGHLPVERLDGQFFFRVIPFCVCVLVVVLLWFLLDFCFRVCC